MRTLLKSLIVFCLTGFSVLAVAGGPEPAEPAPIPAEYAGVYVDLSAGYAAVDWANFGQGSFNGYSPSLMGSVTENGSGGFTFGFDVGYRINKLFAIELGWYRLPKVRGFSDVFTSLPDLELKSWLAFLAFKVIVPFSKQFEFFMKAGAGYRRLDYDGNATGIAGFGDNLTNYVNAVLGAGLQYWFDENWSVSLQYLTLLRNSSSATISKRGPAVNLATLNVAYIFGVM